jgi:uncharacterized membrane protein YccC
VQYKTMDITLGIVVLVLLAGFVWAIWQSKRKVPALVEPTPAMAAK